MTKKFSSISLIIIALVLGFNCGGGQVQDDSPDVYPSSVEMKDADAAIAEAQTAYTALNDDGSAETAKAKEYLDKAKEHKNEKEPEPAWAAANKSKSFAVLSKIMRDVRSAGLK